MGLILRDCANERDIVIDQKRVDALNKAAIREMPADFRVDIESGVDDVTENELIVWYADVDIDGRLWPVGLGAAIIRENRVGPNYLEHRVAVVNGLRESAWHTLELVRLGCYVVAAEAPH